MPAYTTRLALEKPLLSDPADVPTYVGALADDIDDASIFGIGVLSNRPVSTPGSPGISGRFYYANDAGVSTGDLWFDYGQGYRKVALFDTAGNLSGGSLSLQGNLNPSADATYDLGTIGLRWRNAYVSGQIYGLASNVVAGAITNNEINAGAAIARSKLDFGLGLVNADISSSAAITQTKIASVLGLASLSADINYLKGNSGTITLNDSVQISNGKALYALTTGGVQQSVVSIGADNRLYIGYGTALAAIALGHGNEIDTLHANGNAAVRIVPNYWGAGLPGVEWGTDGAVMKGRAYTDGTDFVIEGSGRYLWLKGASGIFVNGMRPHRHPYGGDRHIEAGKAGSNASVTFVDAYAVAPTVVQSFEAGFGPPSAITTTGFTATNDTNTEGWIAEGQD